MSEQFDHYFRKLTLCMMTYQFIEYSLRFCLHRCHAIIKFRLDGHLPYDAPTQSIEDAALGRLIDWYKTFTSNQPLIKELRNIKAERDRIAHQAYVLTLEEQRNDKFLLEKAEELEATHQRAQACLQGLQAEMEKTDKVVNEVYAELRTRNLSRGKTLPASPIVEGTGDASGMANHVDPKLG
jgi:hypothetical protein